jgi:hypothetical protein
MDVIAIATLYNGAQIRGRLTTDHPASSYGRPVFVDDDGQAWDWISLADVRIEPQQARAGRVKSERKAKAARKNGKLGGRPRKA